MIWLYYSLKTWILRYWQAILLVFLAIGFFLATSCFNYLSQTADFIKWSSPDETANYYLTKLYTQTGDLSYSEKYNLTASGIIMPRSFRSDGSLVKPVSFLGIILIYGQLAKLFGTWVIPYLTPAFAGLGLIFFYLIIKRLFDQATALVSAILLSFFPVYIYFSARSMFHNILFIVLWLMGLYFSLRMSDGPSYREFINDAKHRFQYYVNLLYTILAGLLTGLACIVRTSELIWLAPIMAILWLFNFRRLGLIKPLVFLFFFASAFFPIFYWNTVLYSAPLNSGYPQLNNSVNTIVSSSTALVTTNIEAPSPSKTYLLMKNLQDSIFTFGFRPEHSQKMFYYYVVKMFSWLVVASIIGFWLYLFRFKLFRKKDLVYLLSYLSLSAILILYYGSWIFYDNPDPNSYTIGNSYTRYWLPIYLGAIPFSAYAIIRLSRRFIYSPLILAIRLVVIGAIAFSSTCFVLYGSSEGLVPTLSRQIASREEFDQLLSLTDPQGIIITRYHDKLLFPERRVIVGNLTDPNMNRIYADLAHYQTIYYYNFTFSDSDFEYLNSRKLREQGLKLILIKRVQADFSLYQLLSTDKK